MLLYLLQLFAFWALFACFLSSTDMLSIINLFKESLTYHSKPVNLTSRS